MSDWLLNLPVLWMGVVVFAATYLLAAVVYWVVTRLAVNERARTFKSVSPGMLPPLGILFALWSASSPSVWNNYDKAKVAVATEASALRALVLFAENLPEDQKMRIYVLIDRHIKEAVNKEWPTMAQHTATLANLRATALIEELHQSRRTLNLPNVGRSWLLQGPTFGSPFRTASTTSRMASMTSCGE